MKPAIGLLLLGTLLSLTVDASAADFSFFRKKTPARFSIVREYKEAYARPSRADRKGRRSTAALRLGKLNRRHF